MNMPVLSVAPLMLPEKTVHTMFVSPQRVPKRLSLT